jgi:hypothetical protein
MNPLETLAEHSAGGFPNLIAARQETARRVGTMRELLSGIELEEGASVVLFGSWGRQELTNDSDDDWAVIVDGADVTRVSPCMDQIGGLIGQGERRPGPQGVFGDAISCNNLVERIGLEADDNKNLTRRLLLLLESVSVLNDPAHRTCRRRVLEGYLDDSVKSYRPPRFLLNDVIRYWRTICVDFVGKERRGAGEKWALRNLKLGLSRKALFAGGLLPVLFCHRFPAPDIDPFLAAMIELPSIDRIAWAFLELGAVDAGVRAVSAYDGFLGLLGDREVRADLEKLSRDEAMGSEVFFQGKRLARDFQQGLLALLFETPLEPLVREYGIF